MPLTSIEPSSGNASDPISVVYIVGNEIESESGELHYSQFTEKSFTSLDDKNLQAILVKYSAGVTSNTFVEGLRKYASDKSIPFILYSLFFESEARRAAFGLNFDDYCFGDLTGKLLKKIKSIRKVKEFRARKNRKPASEGALDSKMRMMMLKRIHDIIVASLLLLALLPLLIIVAIIIKLESRGPIFYVSKRAGNGFRVFDFYKFRTMFDGADKKIAELNVRNQYGKGAFFKVKDDPRITPFGNFLRSTSLDEIPQLFNVLKGDMCLVGNRPLPLYEAEQLTKDKIASRFLAPAGITGLWQITKRGKEEMSEAERIELDVTYAREYSFLYDLKILLGTLPALMQKERV